MNASIQVIAFDADDTLWVNEPYFQDAQRRFGEIVSEWFDPEAIFEEHYKTEIENIPIYGYGIKGFTLSLIETAMRVSAHRITSTQIAQIIAIGKEMYQLPIRLLPGVEETLESLSHHYRLIVATKGDLLDQERKLRRSGLERHFHHVEVMSDKTELHYQKLLQHLDIEAEAFAMVGNSVRSDILPVLSLGANAIHVPYSIDWVHEKVDDFDAPPDRFHRCNQLSDLLKLFPGSGKSDECK